MIFRPIRSSITQSAPAGGSPRSQGTSLRENSFPASDSTFSHEADIESGLSTPVKAQVFSPEAEQEFRNASRGGQRSPVRGQALGPGTADRRGHLSSARGLRTARIDGRIRPEAVCESDLSAADVDRPPCPEADQELGPRTANRGGPAQCSARSEAPALSQPGMRHGMVLPFQPVTLTFRDVHYSVSVPAVSSSQALSVSEGDLPQHDAAAALPTQAARWLLGAA